MTFTVITCVLALAAIVGVVLNIKRRSECFYIWSVTNFGWVVIDYQAELYAQSALFAVYTALALWGIYEWRSESPARASSRPRQAPKS